jgi:hypothetical protein
VLNREDAKDAKFREDLAQLFVLPACGKAMYAEKYKLQTVKKFNSLFSSFVSDAFTKNQSPHK